MMYPAAAAKSQIVPPFTLWIEPTYGEENTGQPQPAGYTGKTGRLHVEETTPPLAIAIESNGASYDTSHDIDWDSEQVGLSSMVSNL